MTTPIKDFLLNVNARYKNYDFDSVMKVLMEHSKIESKSNKKPILYVIAGPNGSGKSTLATNFFNNQIFGDKFINAGVYAQTIFKNEKDPDKLAMDSMTYAMREFEKLVDEKKNFIYETVLSHESKLDLVKAAKKRGYHIVSIFVFTDIPQINIERIKERTSQGAIDVPENKIVSRYTRSLQNAFILKELSDEFYQFNNSKERN